MYSTCKAIRFSLRYVFFSIRQRRIPVSRFLSGHFIFYGFFLILASVIKNVEFVILALIRIRTLMYYESTKFNLIVMRNIQHIKQSDKSILPIKTSICKPAFLISPLRKTSVIKAFFTIFNDKWNDVIFKTFL